MLESFSVKNYRSFKEERNFSLLAGSIKEHKNSVIEVDKYRLLPLVVFYGANSSGKSNIIQAINTMRRMVLRSVTLNEGDKLPYNPFLLDKDSDKMPSEFEIQFITGAAHYRYGFEYGRQEIISEWLYERRFGEREYELFVRSHDFIEVSEKRFPEGLGKEEMTNSNRLFLSLVGQLKGRLANELMGWFKNCNVLSGIETENYESFSLKMFMEHLDGAELAQQFFRDVQLGFKRFDVKETDIPHDVLEKAPHDLKMRIEKDLESGVLVEPITIHNIYDENGEVIGEGEFPKNMMESEGSKKVIEMSGPIFDTLNHGKVLIVDELDAKLHPLLTRNIVLLFMDKKVNKRGAQLIFATHDTNLLDLSIIRRDQIWFAEKDAVEASDVYSLVEFKDKEGKKVRYDRDIKNDYIQGRYGAIPFIGKH